MNWDAIGAISESLGAAAVLLTLGYLAVQVRHARRELQHSLSQSRADTHRELAMNLSNDYRLMALYSKANAAVGTLLHPFVEDLMQRAEMTMEEVWPVYWNQVAWWQYRVQVIAYVDELPSGQRAAFEREIRVHYAMHPLFSRWYALSQPMLDPDAVRYIDNLPAQPG